MARITGRGRISSQGRVYEHINSFTGRVSMIERFDRNDRLLDAEYFDQRNGRLTHMAHYDLVTGRVVKVQYFDVSPGSDNVVQMRGGGWTIRVEHFDAVSGVQTKVETFEPRPKYDTKRVAVLTSRLRELEVLGKIVDSPSEYPHVDTDTRSVIEGIRARLYHKLRELTCSGEGETLARQFGVLDGLSQIREPLPGVGWPTVP
jgi:hypothetical protein